MEHTATRNGEPWEANGFIGEEVRFPDNWVQFTEYNPATTRLKGRFEIPLKLSEDEIIGVV